MEKLITPSKFITPKQALTLLSGFVFLLITLRLDKYINVYVVMALMFASMALVETICIRIIYNGLFNKVRRLRNWTKKSKFIVFTFCVITLVWTIMLLLILDKVVGVIFHS